MRNEELLMKPLRVSLIMIIERMVISTITSSLKSNPVGICTAIPNSSFLIPNCRVSGAIKNYPL